MLRAAFLPLLLGLLAALPPAFGSARAEGSRAASAPDSALSLPDAVVTATRTSRKAETLPRAVNRVGRAELAERMPRNAAEALKEETGVAVQKTEHGGGNAILRGLGSNQVLLLVDGIRLNNSTYRLGNHPYLTTVDHHMLDRLEVVRGPGSVLHGSDAMGGTINLITRDPDLGSASLAAHGRVHARFASADAERILRADGTVGGHGFGLSAGTTWRESGDLHRGRGGGAWLERDGVAQGPSGYEQRDYDAKLAWRPAAGHRLSLAWQSTIRPEVPRYDRYIEKEPFHRWVYTPQERDLAYLAYTREGAGRNGDTLPLKAFLSWHRQEEGREFQRRAGGNETREWGEARTYGAGVQAGRTFGRHVFTLGADAYLDRVDSRRALRDPATGRETPQLLALYPDGSYYGSYGVFLQDEVALAERWTAVIGGRASLFRMDFGVPRDTVLGFDWGRVEEDFRSVTGSLGFTFLAAPGTWLSAGLSQGFRAPNLNDVAKVGESKGGVYEIPNPELGPEGMVAVETGVKVEKERFRGSLFLHQASIFDLMVTAPARLRGSPVHVVDGDTLKVRSVQNLGEAYIRGVEVEGAIRAWASLWVRGNFAYAHGQNTTLDAPMGKMPPAMGLLGLRWDGSRITADAHARFAARQDRLSAEDEDDPRIQPGGTPPWAVL
ncbi:MAG TPA: TonB-dependent receptor, partial [Fibrobacteria bacterium]|nr:TonB-dependent receptor [Fibrobacteria bacterium]